MEDAKRLKTVSELIAFLKRTSSSMKACFLSACWVVCSNATGTTLRKLGHFYWIRERPFRKGASLTLAKRLSSGTHLYVAKRRWRLYEIMAAPMVAKSVSMAELFLAARFTVSAWWQVKSIKYKNHGRFTDLTRNCSMKKMRFYYGVVTFKLDGFR